MNAVISKLFEKVLLDVCDSYLMSDDLQFGFKKGLGCNNAIFSLHTAIEYFRQRGSTVYASVLDISQAFNNVNHYKLYISLHKAGIPIWIIALLANWYSKLVVSVRLQRFVSMPFDVRSGVRQGSSLLPAIVNIFINDYIIKLLEVNTGRTINGVFVVCIMYADDLILISVTVNGLQTMLNCRYNVSVNLLL